jgi:DNA-binding GntR family transcriptional regulator
MEPNGTHSESALTIAELPMLHEQIREAILNSIVNGEFRPGDRIVESAVARRLQVSQATVREALRVLEQLGIIVTQRNRGAFVRQLTRRDVVEMYEMRALLEGYAARMAVARLTDDKLAQLEQLIHEMVSLAESGDLRAMISRDVEFHATIVELADNSLLTRLWSNVNPYWWTYTAVSGLLELSSVDIARRHFAVVEALRQRDQDLAEIAMQGHLLELRDLVQRDLPYNYPDGQG